MAYDQDYCSPGPECEPRHWVKLNSPIDGRVAPHPLQVYAQDNIPEALGKLQKRLVALEGADQHNLRIAALQAAIQVVSSKSVTAPRALVIEYAAAFEDYLMNGMRKPEPVEVTVSIGTTRNPQWTKPNTIPRWSGGKGAGGMRAETAAEPHPRGYIADNLSFKK